jgi:RHS repeat-associated protein
VTNIKRHDYLPFGEELFAGAGGRTTSNGYSGGDGVRHQFTQKERDIETELDYFLARYYSSKQGRFTSVDPENAGAIPGDPQSWNGYAYARNNPLVYTDPDGRTYTVCDPNGKNCVDYKDSEFDKIRKGGPADGYTFKNGNIYYNGELTATYSNDCLYCGQLINEMGRRSSAIESGVAVFAVAGVVGGVTGGAGYYFLTPYLAPTVTTLVLETAPAVGAASQFGPGIIDKAVNYVTSNPAKVAHIFDKAQHNLGPLVNKVGGQENTVRAVLNALNGKLPSSGVFETTVTVAGESVVVRGSVINGVPKIGTMFIP